MTSVQQILNISDTIFTFWKAQSPQNDYPSRGHLAVSQVNTRIKRVEEEVEEVAQSVRNGSLPVWRIYSAAAALACTHIDTVTVAFTAFMLRMC